MGALQRKSHFFSATKRMSSLVRNLSQEHTMASSVCPSYQAAEENKDLLAPSWGREREALAAHRFRAHFASEAAPGEPVGNTRPGSRSPS